MRQTWCLSVAFLTVVATSAATQRTVTHHWIGPLVGMNYTGVYGSDASGLDARLDLAIGGQVDSDIGASSFFRTGLVYSRRGFESNDGVSTADFKISYLEIPILFGYHIPTTGGFQPFILGGGQLGIRVGCSFAINGGGRSQSSACDSPNFATDFAGIDFAIVGDGGLAIPLGLNRLLVDVRYTQGLVKIESDADIKNRGFTFGLGFMMPVEK